MQKHRFSALTCALLLALAAAGPASASAGGNSNAGDVWLDNVGQTAGPGHEMDPHLSCQDINLWGAKLADSSGTYSIAGWPPSGSKETDYSGSWSYGTSQGGDQVVATINVYELITTAQANGDTPAHNGYHFKLNFGQDPQKHKTFWVSCTSQQLAAMQPTTSQTSTNQTSSSQTSSTSTSTRVDSTRASRVRRRHHRHHRHHRRIRQTRRLSRRPRPARRTSGFTG